LGAKAGVVLNPATSLSAIEYVLDGKSTPPPRGAKKRGTVLGVKPTIFK